MKVVRILKALLAAYVVSGLLLLLLTFLLYKFDLSEQVITAGVVIIYLLSTFAGGLILGKMMKVRKFIWGFLLGVLYFALLLIISLVVYRGLDDNGANLFTTFLLCVGGGMFGGMIS